MEAVCKQHARNVSEAALRMFTTSNMGSTSRVRVDLLNKMRHNVPILHNTVQAFLDIETESQGMRILNTGTEVETNYANNVLAFLKSQILMAAETSTGNAQRCVAR